MIINAKTATALSLLMGALAYPVAGTAQTSTETTSEEQVEVQVIETDQAEEQAEAQGEALEEQAEEVSEQAEEQAEETAEAMEEQAEQQDEMAEEQAEEVEVQTEELSETEAAETPPPGMVITMQNEGEWLASDLLDREITNQNGENIGDISDILLRNEGPEGVIVDVGGFLGLGEKQIAIKWDQLQFSEEGILLDTTEDALKNAQEFVTLEEQRAEAELQAQSAQTEQQASQQTTTLPATDTTESTESMQSTEEVEVEVEEEKPAEGETQ